MVEQTMQLGGLQSPPEAQQPTSEHEHYGQLHLVHKHGTRLRATVMHELDRPFVLGFKLVIGAALGLAVAAPILALAYALVGSFFGGGGP